MTPQHPMYCDDEHYYTLVCAGGPNGQDARYAITMTPISENSPRVGALIVPWRLRTRYDAIVYLKQYARALGLRRVMWSGWRA